MTGRRRIGMIPPARPPQGYVPGAASAPRYSPTIQIVLPGEPDTAVLREASVPPVADEPAPTLAQAAPITAAGLAAIATEDALHLFGGRPLSRSAVARQAYLDANPGPEQIFERVVADLGAAGRLLGPCHPMNPGSGASPAGDDSDVTAPVSPEPVTAEDGPDAEPDCAEGGAA